MRITEKTSVYFGICHSVVICLIDLRRGTGMVLPFSGKQYGDGGNSKGRDIFKK